MPDPGEKPKSKPADRVHAGAFAQIFSARDQQGAPHESLARQIRARILTGSLVSGTRLPSIRALANELALNRNVVEKAFRALRLEGLITGNKRGGTWVSYSAQRRSPRARAGARWLRPESLEGSRAGIKWDLRPGQALVRGLPVETWRRACREAGRHLPPAHYGNPAGELALREGVAAYLGRTRGLSISPENIVITRGSGAAIELIAQGILRAGDVAAVEDPGYRPVLDDFTRVGARILRIPVDYETGHQLEVLEHAGEAPLMVHLTPAHQYPLGTQLSTTQRQWIIDWARRNGSLILENDYDHEFLYEGQRFPSLASKAPDCVALAGTFSKALSPSIRIGFIVGPIQLIRTVRSIISQRREHVSWPLQQILTELLRSGAIDLNIATSCRHARQLRDVICTMLAPFQHIVEVRGHECGMHVALRVRPSTELDVLDRALARAGVLLGRIGESDTVGRPMDSLLLGYGHMQLAELRQAMERIVSVLSELAHLSRQDG